MVMSIIILTFLVNIIFFPIINLAQAAEAFSTVLDLPKPGAMVDASPEYVPSLVKGLRINPHDPLDFDFIVDTGEAHVGDAEFERESVKLIKYFLASLTTPEQDMWVNLSPYEKNRIIPSSFGKTEMGRDLLAEDYILKQLTASLIYPEKEIGKEFWKNVYTRAKKLYGTTNVPINTFNKVWIVPEKAVIYEHSAGAFIVSSHLKVMLEEDYLSLRKHLEKPGGQMSRVGQDKATRISGVSSYAVKEVLIPIIEEEVNMAKNFATLRQIYNSMVLATWYKRNLKQSLLGEVYSDKNRTKGIEVRNINNEIYLQYLEAYKKGAFDFIKEESDGPFQTLVPRKYFSGGINLKGDFAMTNSIGNAPKPTGQFRDVRWRAEEIGKSFTNSDKAMLWNWDKRIREFFNDRNVTILGATGFVGRYLMVDLFKQAGNELRQVKVLTRDPKGSNVQQLLGLVDGLPGKEKLIPVQGDQLNISQVRKIIAGSKVIISTAGLAWQHPVSALDLEKYSFNMPPGMSEKEFNSELLLRQELVQNAISAALLGLEMSPVQRLVWTSTNATDSMFLRLNDDDRIFLKEEVSARAKRYLAYLRQTLASGALNDVRDLEKVFAQFVNQDLLHYPPLQLPRTKSSKEMVSYARVFSYNYSKYLGQRILEMIHDEDGNDIRVLMISDVYGPGQSIDKQILTTKGGLRRTQVFLAAYKAIMEGHQEWIPGHGFNINPGTGEITQNIWRDYVSPTFVGDVTKIILRASILGSSNFPKGKTVFNVSAPPISNEELSTRLGKLFNVPVKVEPTGEELFAQPQGQASDLTLLDMELTALSQGIKKWLSDDLAMVSSVDTNQAESIRNFALGDITEIYSRIREIIKSQNETMGHKKTDGSNVTVADYLVQILTVLKLHELFPQDDFLGEEIPNITFLRMTIAKHPELEKFLPYIETYQILSEKGELKNKEFPQAIWISDPVDGTDNFLNGRNTYAYALARYIWDGSQYTPDYSIIFTPEGSFSYRGKDIHTPLLQYCACQPVNSRAAYFDKGDGFKSSHSIYSIGETQLQHFEANPRAIINDPKWENKRLNGHEIAIYHEPSSAAIMGLIFENHALYVSDDETLIVDHAASLPIVNFIGASVYRKENGTKMEGYSLEDIKNAREAKPFPVIVSIGGEYTKIVDSITSQNRAMPNRDEVGGIDLNPSMLALQLQKSGRGFQYENFSTEDGKGIQIEGIRPVIVDVTSIKNVLPLLELSQK